MQSLQTSSGYTLSPGRLVGIHVCPCWSHCRNVGSPCESGGTVNKSSEAGERFLSEESRAHPHIWVTPFLQLCIPPCYWRCNCWACTLPDRVSWEEWVVKRVFWFWSSFPSQMPWGRLGVLSQSLLCRPVTPAVSTAVCSTQLESWVRLYSQLRCGIYFYPLQPVPREGNSCKEIMDPVPLTIF